MKRTLYIGNKNYSSWSLRGWLVLAESGLAFDEVMIPMVRGATPEIRRVSPSGRVPLLVEDGLAIWDSLAIAEHVAEAVPRLWPEDPSARAIARSISAEMHSGFDALRRALPMNIRRRAQIAHVPDDVSADLSRVYAIWRDARARFGDGEPFLFGAYSIADAMFTPVATRLVTYGVAIDEDVRPYVKALLEHPRAAEWIAAAHAEPQSIPEYDAYVP